MILLSLRWSPCSCIAVFRILCFSLIGLCWPPGFLIAICCSSTWFSIAGFSFSGYLVFYFSYVVHLTSVSTIFFRLVDYVRQGQIAVFLMTSSTFSRSYIRSTHFFLSPGCFVEVALTTMLTLTNMFYASSLYLLTLRWRPCSCVTVLWVLKLASLCLPTSFVVAIFF